MPDYNGLTRNQWPGTWSPSSNHPIVLDTEIRGGLRYVSGDVGDRLSDITGQRLQDGMVVYVENGYTEGTVTYQSGQYYKFNVLAGESRDASTGVLPNDSDNWEFFKPDVSGLVYDSSSGLLTVSTNDGNTFTDSINLNPFSTSNLSEGTNKYYTTARSDSDFDARFDSSFDERLETKSTTNLSEGTNLYFTTARADSDAKHAISGGTGISYSSDTGTIATNDAQIDHNLLLNHSSDEHIAHSGVSIVAGKGLTGGGNISASRTIDIDSANVRGMFSGSNGITYNSSTGDIRAAQPLDSAANPTFNQLRGPANFVIDPAAIGDATGTVQILGNLQVDGTTTTINSTNVSVNDKTFTIADSAPDSSGLAGAGIIWGGASITANKPSFKYNHAQERFDANRTINATSFIGSLSAGNLTGIIDSARIPSLATSDIVTGTFDSSRLPSLAASDIVTGTFSAARIPNLSAGKITSDVFDSARIPAIKIDANRISSGTIDSARIPSLAPSDIHGTFDSAKIPTLKIADLANTTDITSVGTLTGLTVIGTVNADSATFTNVTGTLQTAAQANITSVGNLTALRVDGEIDARGGITDDGGVLVLQSSSGNDIRLKNHSNNSVVVVKDDGTAQLAYNGSTKLITTSSGVTVTGQLVADSATITGNITAASLDISGDVDIDGTLEADAITVDGDTLATVIAGTTVTNATNAANVAVADESTDTTCFPLFVTSNTGNVPAKVGSNLTFNSNSGILYAPILSGTLQTAAQTNVTSLGTLTGLTVSGTTNTGGLFSNGDIGNSQSAKGVYAGLSTAGDAQISLVGDNTDVSPQIDLSHDISIDYDVRLILEDDGNRLAIKSHGNENMARFNGDGAVELYHDNVKKLETTAYGVTATGTVNADSSTIVGNVSAATFTGSGANLTNLPAGQLTDTIDSARIPTLKIADLANTTDIDHDTLTNFEENEHINHTSVSITAGTGLSGGGDISSTRTLKIDSSELSSLYSKVISHDNTSGFVPEEHVDHSGVSIIAGKGLSGGGNITSSRTIDIDSANIDQMIDSNLAGSSVLIDGNGSTGGITISDGLIDMRTGTGSVSKIKFYCEASNAHFQTLQAAPHDSASSAVLVLPRDSGTLALRTDIIDSARISSIISADVDQAFVNALNITATSAASADDADKLDGVQGSSFLRSDAADAFSGVLTATAPIEFNGGVTYDPSSSGAGTDTATDVAISLASGQRIVGHISGYIRNLFEWTGNAAIEIGQNNTGYIQHTKIYGGANHGVELYEGTNKKLETTPYGAAITGAITSTDSAIFGGNGSSSGVKIDDGAITIFSGTGSPGYIDFYCETNNQHRVRVKSDIHTNYADNVDLILPTSKLTGTILTDSSTATLLNKTFDAEGTGNSISNLDVANFKAAAIVTEGEGIGSNDNDTTLPTSAAVKDYVDNNAGGGSQNLFDKIAVSGETTVEADGTADTLTLVGAGTISITTDASTDTITFTGSGGGGGGGTPGGSNTQVQFNDGGSFGGDAGMTFNKTTGVFAATSKSFDIDHPTKEGMRLRYGSLEGPENGVYVRGRLTGNNTIKLPDYWTGLIHEDTITVTLTPIGKPQDLYVEDIGNNQVIIGGEDINCFYVVYGERKDVEKITVEYDK